MAKGDGTTRTRVRPLVVILLLALALRLLAAMYWDDRVDGGFFFGDSEGYWRLGQCIASGETYQVHDRVAFRTPGLPTMLAPLFVVGGRDAPVLWGRFEMAIVGTLAVAAVWLLARTLFDETVALLAALFTALLPNAIFHGALVLTETPFALLMLLGLWTWTLALRAETLSRRLDYAALLGILFGLAVIVRPSGLLLPPFALAVGVLLYRFDRDGDWRRQAMIAVGIVVGMVVVLAPWWTRNVYMTGRFIPTTTWVGASLYDGLNPKATGASDMYFVDEGPLAYENYAELPIGRRELAADAAMKRAAADWACENPTRVAELAGAKLLRMWSPLPNEASLRSPMTMAALGLSYTPLAILAMLGAIWTFRRGFVYWLLWMPAVYFTLLHVVFVSSIRYRMPAMMTLSILAAAALVMIARRMKAERAIA